MGGTSTSIRAPVSSIDADRSPSASSTSARRSERLELRRAAGHAREAEEIGDHAAGAGGRALDHQGGAGDVARLGAGDRVLQKVGEDRDLAQRLLQIVRGDIGELGQALIGDFEVGGAPGELLLRRASGGDVDDGGERDRAELRFDRGQRDLDRKLPPVLARPVKIAARAHRAGAAIGEKAPPQAGVGVAPSGRHEDVDRLADQLEHGVAEHPLGLGVGELDQAVRVDHDHGRGRRVDRHPETVVASNVGQHISPHSSRLRLLGPL